MKINLELNDVKNCYWAGTTTDGGVTFTTNLTASGLVVPSMNSCSLFVDYIYLDTDERRRFAQVSHEYLIEQLQYTGAESTSSGNYKVKLNFNHPTKELVWVVQPDDNISDIAPWGKQWFNYTDSYDHTYDAAGVFGTGANSDIYGGSNVSTVQTGDYGASPVTGLNFITPVNIQAGSMPGIAAGGANKVYIPVSFEDGTNPVAWAKLQLNGHDRFSGREGRYFNLVQPYQHHENIPSAGINVYSFGLKPEEHQPSGTCNFSRIDNATLQLSLTPLSVLSGRTVEIRVYAVNYNTGRSDRKQNLLLVSMLVYSTILTILTLMQHCLLRETLYNSIELPPLLEKIKGTQVTPVLNGQNIQCMG